MFSVLSKTIPPLFAYPLGLACIFLVLAFFLYNKRKWQTATLLVALGILWLSGNRWFAYSLARSLEWQNLPPAEIPTADVIVVLGGGTEPQQYPRPIAEMNGAGDRVLYAGRLYQQGKSAHILVSGGYITWLENRSSTPASEMAEILSWMNIPRESIWIEDRSQNTYENALFTARILKEKGINRIILVTSAMHMPRSLALFKHQGLEVIPAPVDFTVSQDEWDSTMQLKLPGNWLYVIPNSSSLALTTNVIKEYLGIWAYRLKGWL